MIAASTSTGTVAALDLLDAVSVCPACGEGRFRPTWLKTTILLVCENGCPGHRLAVALGLDGWPEVHL